MHIFTNFTVKKKFTKFCSVFDHFHEVLSD